MRLGEVPGHPGWHFGAVEVMPDGSLESEVYFHSDNGHDYPSMYIDGKDEHSLIRQACAMIENQRHLFGGKS